HGARSTVRTLAKPLLILLWLGAAAGAVRAAEADKAKADDGRPSAAVVASLNTASSSVTRGDQLRVWATVENRTASPITNVGVELVWHPGFVGGDDCSVGSPISWSYGSGASASPTTIEGMQAASFTTNLLACEVGERTFAGIVRWSEAGVAHAARFAAEPVEVHSRLQAVDRSIPAFFKDLLLPAGLLWLGWMVSRGEKRKAAYQQVWNQLLAKSHENNEKFYGPMVTALHAMEGALERVGKAETAARPAALDTLFIRLLIFHRHYAHMIAKIGGFYFMSREGEQMAIACLTPYQREAYKRARVDGDELSKLLEEFKPGDSKQAVAVKLAGAAVTPIAAAAKERLVGWVDDGTFARFADLLVYFRLIVDYEMNRIYRFWYGRVEAFRYDDHQTILARLTVWVAEIGARVGQLETQTQSLAAGTPQHASVSRQREEQSKLKEELSKLSVDLSLYAKQQSRWRRWLRGI
ncbi:MAG TPA: hypothetical protein VFS60_10710, partial [Thermoanaerobaculia bacterium]|nr:hypothetical protein [Thermoanaerobaculia bacterium]